MYYDRTSLNDLRGLLRPSLKPTLSSPSPDPRSRTGQRSIKKVGFVLEPNSMMSIPRAPSQLNIIKEESHGRPFNALARAFTSHQALSPIHNPKFPKDVEKSDKSQMSITNRTLQLSSSKLMPKKPPLYDGYHVKSTLQGERPRFSKIEHFRKFISEHQMILTEGQNDNIIQKCIDLIKTETDPMILENNFPGLYRSFIPSTARVKRETPTPQLPSVRTNTEASIFGFPLSQQMQKQNSYKLFFSKGAEKESVRKDSFSDLSPPKLLGMGYNQHQDMPKMDRGTFKEHMAFYKDFSRLSNFYLIQAKYKGAVLDIGFFETQVSVEAPKVCYLSKFYLYKIYRKIKMGPVIAVLVLDKIFQAHQRTEKVTMDVLLEFEGLQNDIKHAGMKLDKIHKLNGVHFNFYSVRRQEFYDFCQDILLDSQ